VPEVEEQGEDLPECVDPQPSSFERGKPWSILSLLLYKSNQLYMSFIYCCIKYRSWVKPLMHLISSLSTLLYPYTLLGLGSNNCLALLRPIAIGDFRSPAIIGSYRNTLVMEWMISQK
jgi:hypothetical protein